MRHHGIEQCKSLYSPPLMESQIRAIDKTLMEKVYFGE